MNEPIKFAPAGEGVTIAFALSDLIEFEKALSSDTTVGTIEIMRRLSALNSEAVKAGLTVALKNPDGSRWQGDLDVLEFNLEQACEALNKAIAIKMFGKPITDSEEGDADET